MLIQSYVATARRRQQQRQSRLSQRWQAASNVAVQASQVLKQEFAAKKVVLFGSALRQEDFHEGSDIDLAVWGLPPKLYFQAVARLLDLSDFSIDLVEAEGAKDYLQQAIAEGKEL